MHKHPVKPDSSVNFTCAIYQYLWWWHHTHTNIHVAFTSATKFEESISLEHQFSVIKLHASRSGEESSPTIR